MNGGRIRKVDLLPPASHHFLISINQTDWIAPRTVRKRGGRTQRVPPNENRMIASRADGSAPSLPSGNDFSDYIFDGESQK